MDLDVVFPRRDVRHRPPVRVEELDARRRPDRSDQVRVRQGGRRWRGWGQWRRRRARRRRRRGRRRRRKWWAVHLDDASEERKPRILVNVGLDGAVIGVIPLGVDRHGSDFFDRAFRGRRTRRAAFDAWTREGEVQLGGLVLEQDAVLARIEMSHRVVFVAGIVEPDEAVAEPAPGQCYKVVFAALRLPSGRERGDERSRQRGRQEQACRATCQALPPYPGGYCTSGVRPTGSPGFSPYEAEAGTSDSAPKVEP